MPQYNIGSIVKCRNREWIVLPSEHPDILQLRPFGGSESELAGIYLPLNLEKIEPATFPLPDPSKAGDFISGKLLRDAARLNFRSGAGPFRSMGRLSVRPRPYQFVPLLMALRQEKVRLLIADDVGVGKTIEALMIARELLDRGEIKRICVVCPPHLCDQWKREMQDKFQIEAVVVRSGTAAQLERRRTRQDISIFKYYPFIVASIDYVKSETRRDNFLLNCADFVIVDEAHTCTKPPGRNVSQQQRHELVSRLASDSSRHLLLVTATPHSGIEESFLSLLSLLKPEFGKFDLLHIQEQERAELARYFVQRQRGDVQKWLGENTPFPKRDSKEESYQLSQPYKELFNDVYEFAREIVRTGESLSGFKRRVRYWAALSLLRALMSSPAAGAASLLAKAERLDGAIEDEEVESQFASQVYDMIDEEILEDLEPNRAIQESETTLPENDRKKLRKFAQYAEALSGTLDEKLKTAMSIVTKLLNEGYQPILYCRYIATAKYVADALAKEFKNKFDSIRVECVTSDLAEDEREQKVQELKDYDFRVLVATDCMSEGINLQELFNAVIHYDLPWNPNRLEQREGRIDRYGQEKEVVKAILLYGKDNPIDGALLDVLIRKAVMIHKTLGITVPVPVNNETVVQAVINSLFMKGDISTQLSLFADEAYTIADFHRDWDRNADREKESRTRFAQHAIKPAEVAEELKETDEILGDPKAVENFIIDACQRLNAPLVKQKKGWRFDPSPLPQVIKDRLQLSKTIRISFESPTPEGYEYIGRNHPLTATLSEYLLETALDNNRESSPASRTGVIKTDSVQQRTTILVLRIRHLLETFGNPTPTLAEEVVVTAFSGNPNSAQWLSIENAKNLLDTAAPKANISLQESKEVLSEVIGWIPSLQTSFEKLAKERAERLLESHRRVRKITHEGQLKVKPQLPVDVLGVYVLLPLVGRDAVSTEVDDSANRPTGV